MFRLVWGTDLFVSIEVFGLFASEFLDFFLGVGEALLVLWLGFVQFGGVLGAV